MQSILDPVTCNFCGVVWDRMASPVMPCTHTREEWETFWQTHPDRRKYAEIANPGVPPSEGVKEARAKLDAAQ